MYFIFWELCMLIPCLTDIPICHLPLTMISTLQDQCTLFHPYPIHLLCNIQLHSTQMTTPCSLSDSETMVLSFLPLPKLLFQLLSQHFLFHLTTKCWGSSGLMPRSSSLFPILHLIESQDFKSHDLHLQTPSTYLSSIFLF